MCGEGKLLSMRWWREIVNPRGPKLAGISRIPRIASAREVGRADERSSSERFSLLFLNAFSRVHSARAATILPAETGITLAFR